MSKDTFNNSASTQAGADVVQTWLGSGYGVVVVAILTALVAPWIMEWLKGYFSTKLETHKLNLKRAEMLFEREVDAARAFMVLKESLFDVVSPGDDDENAYMLVVSSVMSSKNRLREFKFRYWAVLSDETRLLLSNTISMVTKHSDEMIIKSQNCEPYEVTASNHAIGDFSIVKTKLNQIEDALFRTIKVVL